MTTLRHGHSVRGKRTPIYQCWSDMMKRCLSPKSKLYPRYGGRGISVCKRWRLFENFLFDMGEKPKRMSLDRINNDGHYRPSNCRWATQSQQSMNSSQVRILTLDGEKMRLPEWARRVGIKPNTLIVRLRNGWSVRKTLTTPLHKP